MNEDSQYCQPIRVEELDANALEWTGNDASARNHNGAVNSAKGSVDLMLCWKASQDSQSKYIGSYRLKLDGLLQSRFIREDSKSGYVRVRVFHASDNNLYLQANLKGPRILLGCFV